MRVYLAGPIKGKRGYKSAFDLEEYNQQCAGNVVLNPAVLPKGLDEDRYMPICMAMIDAADAVVFLKGWEKSAGARCEEAYAISQGKIRIYPGGETKWKR